MAFSFVGGYVCPTTPSGSGILWSVNIGETWSAQLYGAVSGVFASSLNVTVNGKVPALDDTPVSETVVPVVALSEMNDGPLIDHP